MRRIITMLLAAAMALSALQVSAAEEAPAGHAIEKKTFPHLYCFHEKTEPKTGEINLYFIDGGDVPYVALSEFLPVLTEMYNVSLECEEDQQVSFETQTADQPDGGVFSSAAPTTAAPGSFSRATIR